jgi:hypothetical protein
MAIYLPLPFCDRALAAAVFEAALVRPSLRTLLAADAALLLVCLVFLAMKFVLARFN